MPNRKTRMQIICWLPCKQTKVCFGFGSSDGSRACRYSRINLNSEPSRSRKSLRTQGLWAKMFKQQLGFFPWGRLPKHVFTQGASPGSPDHLGGVKRLKRSQKDVPFGTHLLVVGNSCAQVLARRHRGSLHEQPRPLHLRSTRSRPSRRHIFALPRIPPYRQHIAVQAGLAPCSSLRVFPQRTTPQAWFRGRTRPRNQRETKGNKTNVLHLWFGHRLLRAKEQP